MDQAPDTQRFLSEVDQKAQPIATLVQVEQALLYIFREKGFLGFGLYNEFLTTSPDHKIYSSGGNDNSVKGNRDFYFSLEL